MHLSGGTIFGILSLWGYRTRHYLDNGPQGIRLFGGFGTHGRLIVSLAVSCFGLWVWNSDLLFFPLELVPRNYQLFADMRMPRSTGWWASTP